MGLDIVFYFEDGRTDNIRMRYSNFSRRVMRLREMIRYKFTDHDGCYMGRQLDYLIRCLDRSGYLRKPYDPKPYKAEFH
jgi:hypothetical protein